MIRQIVLAAGLALSGVSAALAGDAGARTLVIGGINNIFIPAPGKARGSMIVMTGGDGRIDAGTDGTFTKGRRNAIIRTRQAWLDAGFDLLLVDLGTSLPAAVAEMARIKRPVIVLTTSRGTIRGAEGLAAGARPDKLILTSGILTNQSGDRYNVQDILGDPALLPPTLVIAHRHDECRKTRPEGVEPFAAWAGKKVKVIWLDGGITQGDPCEALGHHGYNGIEDQFTRAVITYAEGK